MTFDYGGRTPSNQTVEWYTPPFIFEAIGLNFDLDPCAPPGGLPWTYGDVCAEAVANSGLGMSFPCTGMSVTRGLRVGLENPRVPRRAA